MTKVHLLFNYLGPEVIQVTAAHVPIGKME